MEDCRSRAGRGTTAKCQEEWIHILGSSKMRDCRVLESRDGGFCDDARKGHEAGKGGCW